MESSMNVTHFYSSNAKSIKNTYISNQKCLFYSILFSFHITETDIAVDFVVIW